MGFPGDITQEFLTKYPTMSSHRLARLIMVSAPTAFTDVESCRSAIRYYRGVAGDTKRRSRPGEDYRDRVQIRSTEAAEFSPYVLSHDACPVMVGADAHIPYHDQDALEMFLERATVIKPKTLILLGDWLDLYQCSVYCRDPRLRSIPEELSILGEILATVKKVVPEAKIIYLYGNHEERWDRYLYAHAPELAKVPSMELEEHLPEGLEVISHRRMIQLGHLHLIHGHEYRPGLSVPVNPARSLYLKARKAAMCGHWHQTSEHPGTAIDGDVTTCWSIGCLGDLHPEYAPYNNWNLGFAEIYAENEDFFSVRNRKILRYRLV